MWGLAGRATPQPQPPENHLEFLADLERRLLLRDGLALAPPIIGARWAVRPVVDSGDPGRDECLLHQVADGLSVVFFGFFSDRLERKDAPAGPSAAMLDPLIAAYRAGRLDAELASREGRFLLLILDARDAALTVANDHAAQIPFYYAADADGLRFAPQFKAFAPVRGGAGGLDPAALASYLFNGYVIGDGTLDPRVRLLPPASLLRFDARGLAVRRYWEIPFREAAPDPGEDRALEILDDAIGRAFGRMVPPGAGPLGLFFSGGHDSRLILGYTRRLFPGRPLRLVAYGHDPARPDLDIDVARRVAERCGLPIDVVEWQADDLPGAVDEFVDLGEGMLDEITAYPAGFAYLRAARRLGLHWLMGGHNLGSKLAISPHEHSILNGCYIYYPGQVEAMLDLLRRDAKGALLAAYRGALEALSASCPYRDPLHRHGHFYHFVLRHRFLGGHKLLQRSFLDVREPLLGRPVLEAAAELPARYRARKQLLRRLLARRFPDLAGMPISLGKNHVPWSDELRANPRLQEFLLDSFAAPDAPLFEWIDRPRLLAYLHELFGRPDWFTVVRRRVRRIFRQTFAPGTDPLRRPMMQGKGPRLIFRLLLLGRWLSGVR